VRRVHAGFLRQPLLAFYSTASDFTRRLVSVRANAKFSDLGAGPDIDWEAKPAKLGDVVAHLKKE
jgi:raffinose synthase